MTEALQPEDLKKALASCGVPEGEKLAVAVSGGPDSLCLALLAAEVADIVCITVDHGLRAEAASEAKIVAHQMADKGIKHHILKWQGDKPQANLQAEARVARYALMAAWCAARGIRYLLTAHHQDDQAETLLLRLARGSGVYGLAAMPKVSHLPGHGGDLTLVRPFLAVPKSRLKQALIDMGLTWIEDPSNKAGQFDRVKVREFLKNPPLEGMTAQRLAETAGRLRRTRDALEYYEIQWLQKYVELTDDGRAIVTLDAFDAAPEEIILRGIATICRTISGERYVPRMEKLERAVAAMRKGDFTGHTLYGVQAAPLGQGRVHLFRELAAAEARKLVDDGGSWDNRFEISVKGDIAGLEIGPLGLEGWALAVKRWPELRDTDMPFAARLVLPTLFKEENIVAIPHLGAQEGGGTAVNLSLKNIGWLKK